MPPSRGHGIGVALVRAFRERHPDIALETEDVAISALTSNATALDGHPECSYLRWYLVEALILAVTWSRPIEYMRRQHDVTRAILDVAPEILLEGSMTKMFSPRFFELGRETIDQMIKAFARDGGPNERALAVLRGQLDAMDKFDALAELSSITVPTLLLGGKLDMMAPAFAMEEIAAAIFARHKTEPLVRVIPLDCTRRHRELPAHQCAA